MTKSKQKVGTLEIEMASNFNPKIVEVEVEQRERECRNAIDVLAGRDPQGLERFLEEYDKGEGENREERDVRVPYSLVTKQAEDG